jgi:hypothetical protein
MNHRVTPRLKEAEILLIVSRQIERGDVTDEYLAAFAGDMTREAAGSTCH